MPPSVDVVVVNFNSGRYLRRSLASVYESTLPVNVIVVDNTSGDESIDLAHELDPGQHSVQFVLNEENVGFSAAVNIGARHATGQYLLLLNPDCEVHPHTIERLESVLSSHPSAGIVGALVFNEDGTEQRGCRRREPTLARSIITALRQDHRYEGVNLLHQAMPSSPVAVDAVSGAALMVRRSSFDAVSGMDEGYFLHVEDLDICKKIRALNQQVLFAPTVSVFHHQGVSSRRVPVRTEWHKHKGMARYYSLHQKAERPMWANAAYYFVVWSNFLLTLVRQSLRLLKPNKPYPDQPLELTHLGNKRLTVLTGASSDLGGAILAQDLAEPVIALTRGTIPRERVGNEVWMNWQFFEKAPADDFGDIKRVILASPIWSAPALAKMLHRFGGVKRLVAFSSTSVEGKANSLDRSEQYVVQSLNQGEKELLDWSSEAGVESTILRASMIYGGKQNQNIGFIANVLRLFRFFPLVGSGEAKRQPVHIDDLAAVCATVISSQQSTQAVYNVAGGEILSYKAMVEAIFESLNIQPRFIPISETRLKWLLQLFAYVPGLGFLKPEMATRMASDLTYDITPAKTDLDYNPGIFRP